MTEAATNARTGPLTTPSSTPEPRQEPAAESGQARLEEAGRRGGLVIAGVSFTSRLFVGTGKFASARVMADAVAASRTELVTVALRRVDLEDPADPMLAALDWSRYRLLPNTSGARDAEEAVRLAKLARLACRTSWLKLEVTPDPNYLLPDGTETLRAAEQLVKLGFTVLPYIGADPVLAKRLAEAGCATVMPLAAPIGSNQGLRTRDLIAIIIEQATVPVVVDAGLGMPSHAAEAIEMGADAVLVNTAIATANDPVRMADAFRLAVQAAELARESGPLGAKTRASASSPLTGFLRAEA